MDQRLMTELTSYLLRGGAHPDKIVFYLKVFNGTMTAGEIQAVIEQAQQKVRRNITQLVDIWIGTTNGWFTTSDLYRDNDIRPDEKHNVIVALGKLVIDDTLEKDGKINGKFRLKNHKLNILDWKAADISKVWDIKLPLRLHELVTIYPQNVIIFAGEKNVGKTAIANAIIRHNMANHKIRLLNSEAAAEEFKARRMAYPGVSLDEWTDEVVTCSGYYADQILRDGFNIVDFLEIRDGEFTRVADMIRNIYEALGTGICVIFLQKKKGAEFGRGAEFGNEKARLICTLHNGNPRQCFVQMVKSPKVEPNPSGLKIWYHVINSGSQIQESGREYYDGIPKPKVSVADRTAVQVKQMQAELTGEGL